MRLSSTLLIGALSLGSAASFAIAASSTPSLPSGYLPLGDNKYVTNAPKNGYIYLCNARKDEQGGGAGVDGPWIQGPAWVPSQKATVDGAVTWPQASFSTKTSGTSRMLTTNMLPSHTTGVYPIASTDDAYKYDRNPNSIKKQNTYTLTVPKDPTASKNANCMGGEVGIALTGVAIFNGFDATLRDAGAHEVQDGYNGHPQVMGQYHYHNISDSVVSQLTKKGQRGPTLIGYAYDGFGIYAGTESGKVLTNADLDDCHGKTSAVMWDGKMKTMYHYVVTKEFPYTVGCFKGTPVRTNPADRPQTSSSSSRQGQLPVPPSGPPAEAIAACNGKQTGMTCQFSDSHGSHAGVCQSPRGQERACVPAQ